MAHQCRTCEHWFGPDEQVDHSHCKLSLNKILRKNGTNEACYRWIPKGKLAIPKKRSREITGSLHGRGSKWPDKWSRGYEGH